MKRRSFISGTILASPLLWAAGCKSPSLEDKMVASPLSESDLLIEKAKKALFCMQRAPWEQGVALQAMIELGDTLAIILMAHEAVVRQEKQGRLAFIGDSANVTDPVSNGPGVLEAYRHTGDEQYKQAADRQYRYVKEIAPRSPNGSVYHLDNAPEIWSDSLFMCPLFLAWYGDFDEAFRQVEGYRQYLWNGEKKLFAHRFNPETGKWINPKYWGGGNGWAASAFAILWDKFPEGRKPVKESLAAYAKDLLDGCIAHMRPDGLFHNNVDDPESFVETNLGQMLAFSIFKGVKSGWLDPSYLEAGQKMRAGALSKMDEYGLIQGACGSPYFNRPGTSTEAQAFFIMMETAWKSIQ